MPTPARTRLDRPTAPRRIRHRTTVTGRRTRSVTARRPGTASTRSTSTASTRCTGTASIRGASTASIRSASTVTTGLGIVEHVLIETGRPADSAGYPACTHLTHGFGERGEFVILGDRSREPPLAAQHLPAARNRDASRMLLAQIP